MGMLQRFGVPVPKGAVAMSAEQTLEVAKRIGNEVVVKAQVLAGGRGKGHFTSGFQGGVQLVNSCVAGALPHG